MANKLIHELFPERTRRVRRGRGFSADVTVQSVPSVRDFFEALGDKLVYYNETLIAQDMKFCGLETTHVDAFYHESDPEHQRYGYIHYGICNCTNCGGLGLSSCLTGRDLYARVANAQRYIHWQESQDLFLVNLCRYTTDMQVITPIVEYFYPYEEDKKPALLLQVRLIEQQKEIARERAEARARYRPPTWYNEPETGTPRDVATFYNQPTDLANITTAPGVVVNEVTAPVIVPDPVMQTPDAGQINPDNRTYAQLLNDSFARERANWTERVIQVNRRAATFRAAVQQLQLDEDRRIFNAPDQAATQLEPATELNELENRVAQLRVQAEVDAEVQNRRDNDEE